MMLKMILAATVWALLVSHPEYFKKMLMINLNAASFIGSLTHKIVERDTDIQSFWKPPDLHFLFSCVVYKKKNKSYISYGSLYVFRTEKCLQPKFFFLGIIHPSIHGTAD